MTAPDEAYEVRAEYDTSAPPEVVQNTLTDASRVRRWLPVGMTAEPKGRGRLRIRDAAGAAVAEVLATVDLIEVDWRSPAGHVHATVEVRDGGAGASAVAVVVRAPAGLGDPDLVRALVAETAEKALADVADNFTAG